MKKIAIVTSTRAEYGLLYPVIRELRKKESNLFCIELIVTGTHLSKEYGLTINEIINSGVRVDKEIPISVDSKDALDISQNQADALVKFTALFLDEKYDAVIILGDRYEMLSVAIAAGNTLTPVFHLCGGDTTEGAIDEWIRHSITKISYLHFVTNEESRKRVIQLGEDPDRVFNYGSTSIDNIVADANLPTNEILESLGLGICKYALCTYHPVTMADGDIHSLVHSFVDAVRSFPEICFIVTMSNSDQGGEKINNILKEEERMTKNLRLFSSLGFRKYLSLMRNCEFVLGNSSSGIVEAPFFHVPTVNIGDRQKGRLQCDSIINCNDDTESIIRAIKVAVSDEHKRICRKSISLYGNGNSGRRISDKCFETVMDGKLNLQKSFYML